MRYTLTLTYTPTGFKWARSIGHHAERRNRSSTGKKLVCGNCMVDYDSEKLQLMTHDLDIGRAVRESGYQNVYFTVQNRSFATGE